MQKEEIDNEMAFFKAEGTSVSRTESLQDRRQPAKQPEPWQGSNKIYQAISSEGSSDRRRGKMYNFYPEYIWERRNRNHNDLKESNSVMLLMEIQNLKRKMENMKTPQSKVRLHKDDGFSSFTPGISIV